MTSREFRDQEPRRQELAEVLRNSSLNVALMALLEDAQMLCKFPPDAPEIVSVRVLAYREGAEDLVRTLYQMIHPNPVAPKEIAATFQQDEAFQKLEEAQQNL